MVKDSCLWATALCTSFLMELLSVWLMVECYHAISTLPRYMNAISNYDRGRLLRIMSHFATIGGMVAILGGGISFVCWKTNKAHRVRYVIYSYLMWGVTLVAIYLTAASCIFVNNDFKEIFSPGFSVANYSADLTTRSAVDAIQKDLMCCGNKRSAEWERGPLYRENNPNQSSIPVSCYGTDQSSDQPTDSSNKTDAVGNATAPKLYTNGCLQALSSRYSEILTARAVILVIIAITEAFAIVVFCLLVSRLPPAEATDEEEKPESSLEPEAETLKPGVGSKLKSKIQNLVNRLKSRSAIALKTTAGLESGGETQKLVASPEPQVEAQKPTENLQPVKEASVRKTMDKNFLNPKKPTAFRGNSEFSRALEALVGKRKKSKKRRKRGRSKKRSRSSSRSRSKSERNAPSHRKSKKKKKKKEKKTTGTFVTQSQLLPSANSKLYTKGELLNQTAKPISNVKGSKSLPAWEATGMFPMINVESPSAEPVKVKYGLKGKGFFGETTGVEPTVNSKQPSTATSMVANVGSTVGVTTEAASELISGSTFGVVSKGTQKMTTPAAKQVASELAPSITSGVVSKGTPKMTTPVVAKQVASELTPSVTTGVVSKGTPMMSAHVVAKKVASELTPSVTTGVVSKGTPKMTTSAVSNKLAPEFIPVTIPGVAGKGKPKMTTPAVPKKVAPALAPKTPLGIVSTSKLTK